MLGTRRIAVRGRVRGERSPRLARLVESLLQVRSLLFRPPPSCRLANRVREPTDTHPALAMSGQCILSREPAAAGALVRLVARVDLGMALEVVLADEALSAAVAAELAVA